MVVFTCNHCGDSLQKPKVTKHYQTTCSRNPIALTCVDCFKDFNLQEYVVHTTCMTEEDRYSAKGTAPKILKGAVKQTEWVNTVNAIIEQQINAKPGVKDLLEALINYDNIPRKKAKFLNFMRSTFNSKFNMRDVEQVWNLLEEYKNALQNKAKEEKEKNENGEAKQEKTENVDESNQEKKSKKKKSKETTENGDAADATVENGAGNKSKKNKKKSKETTENGDAAEETVGNGAAEKTVENGTSGKTKKKRKSKQTDTTEQDIPEKKQKLNEANEEIKVDTSSKKRKRKSQQQQQTNEANVVETKKKKTNESNGVDKSKTKKKKTNKSNGVDKSKTEENQNETFSFKQLIEEILTNKHKGLSKEALQNKVFQKYEASVGPIENQEKLLKKYNKKLRNMKNITCDNDKYKLNSSV